MKRINKLFVLVISASLCGMSCNSIDIYEKSVPIPGHAWQNSFRPSFDFTIKDTTVLYQTYLVLRHNEKYNYSNIYINLYTKGPGQDSVIKMQRDLSLASNENWNTNTAMDDIYEHRIKLLDPQTFKAGNYQFTVEQIMRENPLQNVLDVGIRVEKQ